MAMQRGMLCVDDLGSPVWMVPSALSDLNMSNKFSSLQTKVVPRLLTTTKLFDHVRQRMVVPEELWLIQGWPVPGLAPANLSRDFPHDLSQITSAQHAVLMGNAMNLCGIGAVSMWCLGGTTKHA